jgi:hypothetical protein
VRAFAHVQDAVLDAQVPDVAVRVVPAFAAKWDSVVQAGTVDYHSPQALPGCRAAAQHGYARAGWPV